MNWRAAAGAATLALVACTVGHEFVLPAPGTLSLGKTTDKEVLSLFGPPMAKAIMTVSESDIAPSRSVFDAMREPGVYEVDRYWDIDRTGQIWWGALAGSRPDRTLTCAFWNGTLISYIETSSFDADSTNFDDGKVEQLVRDKSTRDDVVALFGKPSGGAVYPAIARRDGTRLSYAFAKDDLHSNAIAVKSLMVFVDASGVVRDFSANSQTLPLSPTQVFTGLTPLIPARQ